MLSHVAIPRAAREPRPAGRASWPRGPSPNPCWRQRPNPRGDFRRACSPGRLNAALADPQFTPSRRRATEAIPPGGSVLDVGAGGGAASLPLVPPAGVLIAVDESQAMLDVFAEGAERCGVRHREIVGRWPGVAPDTPEADVVVCHHVAYNVGDLAPFLAALTDHAQGRVVVELTDHHPQSDLSPLWRSLHGIAGPKGPTATDAAEVAAALGYDVHVERFERPSLWHDAPRDERVGFARRRLCVGPEHDAEVGAFLDELLTWVESSSPCGGHPPVDTLYTLTRWMTAPCCLARSAAGQAGEESHEETDSVSQFFETCSRTLSSVPTDRTQPHWR